MVAYPDGFGSQSGGERWTAVLLLTAARISCCTWAFSSEKPDSDIFMVFVVNVLKTGFYQLLHLAGIELECAPFC